MWIELHDSVREHPKVLKLAKRLGIGPGATLGYVTSLWCWTLRMAADGDLSSFDAEDIAIGAQWEGEASTFIAGLVAVRLLDETEHGYIVHDWDEYAGSLKSAERARKYRNKKRVATSQSRDGSVTATLEYGDITQTDRPTDRQTNPPTDRPKVDGVRDGTVLQMGEVVDLGRKRYGWHHPNGHATSALQAVCPLTAEEFLVAGETTKEQAARPGFGYFASVVASTREAAQRAPPRQKTPTVTESVDRACEAFVRGGS